MAKQQLTNVDDFINEAVNGLHDDRLEEVSKAIEIRLGLKKDVSTQTKFFSFHRNQRVVFNSGVNPKYMVGVTGKIVDKKRTKVVVEVDPGQHIGRFAGNKRITCPVSILDKIE